MFSCGGDKKPAPKKPVAKAKPEPAKKETEEDRERKRHDAAVALIPEGTSCLPPSLKNDSSMQLQLGAVGADAIVCANDRERSRLLGPVACWKIDLASGDLTYQAGTPLPGTSLMVKVEDGCVRGYCLKGAKLDDDAVAYMTWSPDKSKVAVLAGEDVHIFDAESKSHESKFSVRGDKGVTNEPSGVHWVGDEVFVEGHDAGPAAGVFVFKSDGTPVGPIMSLGGKEAPVSTFGGSFVVLDKTRVAVAEQGFTTVTTYEADSGKRAKINRKLAKAPCKPAELDAFWHEQGDVPAKCKDFMTKNFGHLIGADAVAGKTNLLVLLRGPRLGELAVLDAKTLAEKKSIKMAWCEGGDAGGGAKASSSKASKDDDAADDEAKDTKDTKKDKHKSRGPTKKGAKEEDPDQGGE